MQLILAILCGISAVIWAFVLVAKYHLVEAKEAKG